MGTWLQVLEWVCFGMGAITVWRYGYSARQGAVCGVSTAAAFMAWGALGGLWGAFTINIGFFLLHAHNLRRAYRHGV